MAACGGKMCEVPCAEPGITIPSLGNQNPKETYYDDTKATDRHIKGGVLYRAGVSE